MVRVWSAVVGLVVVKQGPGSEAISFGCLILRESSSAVDVGVYERREEIVSSLGESLWRRRWETDKQSEG